MKTDKTKKPWVDPILAELDQTREKMLREAGGDPHVLFERMRAAQATSPLRFSDRRPQEFTIPPDMLEPKTPTPHHP